MLRKILRLGVRTTGVRVTNNLVQKLLPPPTQAISSLWYSGDGTQLLLLRNSHDARLLLCQRSSSIHHPLILASLGQDLKYMVAKSGSQAVRGVGRGWISVLRLLKLEVGGYFSPRSRREDFPNLASVFRCWGVKKRLQMPNTENDLNKVN